jgi:hypothetical protein
MRTGTGTGTRGKETWDGFWAARRAFLGASRAGVGFCVGGLCALWMGLSGRDKAGFLGRLMVMCCILSSFVFFFGL